MATNIRLFCHFIIHPTTYCHQRNRKCYYFTWIFFAKWGCG